MKYKIIHKETKESKIIDSLTYFDNVNKDEYKIIKILGNNHILHTYIKKKINDLDRSIIIDGDKTLDHLDEQDIYLVYVPQTIKNKKREKNYATNFIRRLKNKTSNTKKQPIEVISYAENLIIRVKEKFNI